MPLPLGNGHKSRRDRALAKTLAGGLKPNLFVEPNPFAKEPVSKLTSKLRSSEIKVAPRGAKRNVGYVAALDIEPAELAT